MTRSTKRPAAALLLAAVCASASVAGTAAQEYPARVIRIVVPFVAGGPTDLNARMVAQKLTEAWGQSVIVENRPGAGGAIGTDLVAKAAPDGYTLLGANPGPLTVAPGLNPRLTYDPQRDFAPVILVTNTTSVLAVHPTVPARTVQELITIARARPGNLTYGTPGVGTVGHLTWELFNSMAGTRMTHVPYKGTAQATTDFLAGQIDLRSFSVPVALPLRNNGKARIIGINGLQRSPLMPDVPTVDESGLKGFESGNWNGIVAPAATPRAIITRLHAEIERRVIRSELRERLLREGYEVTGLDPAAFTAYLKQEAAKWAKVIKSANVRTN